MPRSNRSKKRALLPLLLGLTTACAAAAARADSAASAGADAAAPTPPPASAGERPDPGKNVHVSTLLNQQAAAARRVDEAQIGNIQARLQALRGGVTTACEGFGGPRLAGIAAAPQRPAGPELATEAPAATPLSMSLATCRRSDIATVWSAGSLEVGEEHAVVGGRGFGIHSPGATFGVDRRVTADLAIGLGIGYAHERADAGGDGTYNAANGFSASTYLTYRPSKESFVDVIAGYGGASMRSARRVGERASVAGERSGSGRYAALAAGYRIGLAGADLAPYARLEASKATLRRCADNDGSAEALQYERQAVPALKVAFGLEGSSIVDTPFGNLSPRGRVEVRREVESSGAAAMTYADDRAATTYTMDATGAVRSSMSLGLGATLAVRGNWTIGADYAVDYSGNVGVGRLDLKVSWKLP